MHYIITPTVGDAHYLEETVLGVRRALKAVSYRHLFISKGPLPRQVGELAGEALVLATDAGTGLYPALNTGLRVLQQRGDCDSFSYINDDDGIFPQYAAMLAEHNRSGADVTYGGVEYVDAGGRFCGHVSISREPEDLLPLFQSGCPGLTQQAAIFSERFLKAGVYFNESLILAADSMLFVESLSAGFKFEYFDDTVAYYRRRPGQLSSDVACMNQEAKVVTARARQVHTAAWRRWQAKARFRLGSIGNIAVRWSVSGAGTSRQFFNRA